MLISTMPLSSWGTQAPGHHAVAQVLTTSLRLLRPQEEVKAAAECCMSP